MSSKIARLTPFQPHHNELSALRPSPPQRLLETQSDPQIAKFVATKRKHTEVLFNEMRLFELECNESGRYCSMRQLPSRRIRSFTGIGMLVLPNGKRFRGEWVEGMIVGEAEVFYPNGNFYKGPLYNFQKHGWGILQLGRGERYEG